MANVAFNFKILSLISLSIHLISGEAELLPLEWLGWSPSVTLSPCQGNCDDDEDCKGTSVCIHDSIPDGCYGTRYDVGYCSYPNYANYSKGMGIYGLSQFSHMHLVVGFLSEICSCCTASMCESVTYNPTQNPTVDPTQSLLITSNYTTESPTQLPSFEPTYNPTRFPTGDPTTSNPTMSPTQLSTENPSSAPSGVSSSAPSDAPSLSPSQNPTGSPSESPTQPPTDSPTNTPTEVPTQSPSHSPTGSPISLQEALKEYVDDELPFDDTASWMMIIIGGLGFLVVITATVYGRGICEKQRYSIDDQQLGGVLVYFMQLVDLYSDIILSIQFRLYYLWSKDRGWIPQRTVDILNWLFILSMAFVAVPYFGNIGSAMNVVQRISTDKVISRFSKEYFREHTKLYTLLVLLSGGSIRALKFMSSNLLGSFKFSSGLSPRQIQQFHGHHVIGTVLMKNIPQLIMQGFFMFDLNMYTNTVLISFISSVLNLVLSIKTEVDQCLANQHLSESPFIILLNWTCTGKESAAPVDPQARTGRRQALSANLSAITYGTGGAVTVQITSCKRNTGSTEICGVLEFDGNIDTVDGVFERFEQKKEDIEFAVLRCFGFDSEYMTQYDLSFDIEISRYSAASRLERIKMTKELLSEVGIDQEKIIEWEQSITARNPVARQLNRTMGARTMLDLDVVSEEIQDTGFAELDVGHKYLNGRFGIEMAMAHHLQLTSLSSVTAAGGTPPCGDAKLSYGPEACKEDLQHPARSPTLTYLDHTDTETELVYESEESFVV